MFAGVNLTPFDHYMKDDLGIKQYVRYMDDWVVISDDLEYLKHILFLGTQYLTKEAKLAVNPKTRIIPITHGIDYCGYHIFREFMKP